MNIIIITDDNNGISFNKRRQSKDIRLREQMLKYIKDKNSKLIMNSYSFEQFSEDDLIQNNIFLNSIIKVNDDISNLPENAIENDAYYFFENSYVSLYKNIIDEIVIFNWNTRYPADEYFDMSLEDYLLSSLTEFEGNSHKKITMEVYKKCQRKPAENI